MHSGCDEIHLPFELSAIDIIKYAARSWSFDESFKKIASQFKHTKSEREPKMKSALRRVRNRHHFFSGLYVTA
jgi:HD-like signal output (HDOD) protein